MSEIVQLWFDGSGRGRWGAVLRRPGERDVEWRGQGGKTNNEAEWLGLLNGIKKTIELLGTNIIIEAFGDSQLVVYQFTGVYRVKAPNLRPLYREAKALVGTLLGFTIKWVPRERNADADRLAGRTDR